MALSSKGLEHLDMLLHGPLDILPLKHFVQLLGARMKWLPGRAFLITLHGFLRLGSLYLQVL